MNITIIGAGNTATVLAMRMHQRGHRIAAIWSRRLEQAQLLAAQVGARPLANIASVSTEAAELCLLCVNDAAIVEVAAHLQLRHTVLAHAAGSIPMQVLAAGADKIGVLYPLQRMRPEQPPADIPFLIDGNCEAAYQRIETLATSIAAVVQRANDAQRLRLHLAAVVSGNFTQHLLALTEDWCRQEGGDARLLLPLLYEIVGDMGAGVMAARQTGPARRGDLPVLEHHLELLQHQPVLAALYRRFSESIYGMYHKNGELRWKNTAT